MTPAERAVRAHALAEAADDPRDKAAYRAATRAWEKIASPGVTWSNEPLRRDLAQLKRDIASATGPFQAPKPTEQPAEDIHSAEAVRERFVAKAKARIDF